jgi:hypothetical protein
LGLEEQQVRDYAKGAAQNYGVGPDRQPKFLKERAKADLKAADKKGKKKKDDESPSPED